MNVLYCLALVMMGVVPAGAEPGRQDYPGGFDGDRCVAICPAGGRPRRMMSRGALQPAPRDWDYLLLEQLFIPQYCRLLEEGVDVTVSHQRVTHYPDGTQCLPDRVSNTLTVHGLWPNYFHGYPTCCSGAPLGGPPNLPLDPQLYESSFPPPHPLSAHKMEALRLDPAVPDAHASLCNLANHEWQKHGYCLGLWDDDGAGVWNVTHMAAQYFNVTFLVAAEVSDATATLDDWAATGVSPSTPQVRALYPRRVELLCARSRGGGGDVANRLLAIRTCWDLSKERWRPPTPRDCFPEQPSAPFEPCDSNLPLLLDKYVPPSSHNLISPAHQRGIHVDSAAKVGTKVKELR